MAYQDALFQLGMDLTRSSTAQKEDHGESAPVAHTVEAVSPRHGDCKNLSRERDGVSVEGISGLGNHLIIDLSGARRLDDLEHIERTLKRSVEASGATLLHVHLHPGMPDGRVTGVAVLSNGHISIHGWPQVGKAALDVFMGGHAKAHMCIGVLQEAFAAETAIVRAHTRGAAGEDWVSAQPGDRRAEPVAKQAEAARSGRTRAKVRNAA